jgi:hypothetical protein
MILQQQLKTHIKTHFLSNVLKDL